MKNDPKNSVRLELKILFAFMLIIQSVALIEELGPEALQHGLLGLFNAMDDQRGLILLFEFFGTAILFVDMVIRYDFIPKRIRTWHLLGVAFCAMCWCFQVFVHFFDSAYLN